MCAWKRKFMMFGLYATLFVMVSIWEKYGDTNGIKWRGGNIAGNDILSIVCNNILLQKHFLWKKEYMSGITSAGIDVLLAFAVCMSATPCLHSILPKVGRKFGHLEIVL